jgi:hypothetical protein
MEFQSQFARLHDPLHDLEDVVGSSLATAIDKLTFDTGDQPRLEAETYLSSFSTSSISLLKFTQDQPSRALLLLNVNALSDEFLSTQCLVHGPLRYIETEFKVSCGFVLLAFQVLRRTVEIFVGISD